MSFYECPECGYNGIGPKCYCFVKADHIGHMTLYQNGRTVCLTCQEEE